MVQFMQTGPSAGTVRMRKKHQRWFVRDQLENGAPGEKCYLRRCFYGRLLRQDIESDDDTKNPQTTSSGQKAVIPLAIRCFDKALIPGLLTDYRGCSLANARVLERSIIRSVPRARAVARVSDITGLLTYSSIPAAKHFSRSPIMA
jgi:hypothetical protein